MRKTLGFGVVLAAAYLTGTVGMAYGQAGRSAPAPRPPATNPARSALGNVEQQAAQAAGLDNSTGTTAPASGQPATTVPGQSATTVPGQSATTIPGQPATTIPGQPANMIPGQPATTVPASGAMTTTPANTYQVPGITGTQVNPAGTATAYPGTTTTYSSSYYQAGTIPGTYTGATPGYTNRTMPGMAGYNSVNPMATTMAPGYYYAGTAGMPYATGTTTGYAPTYGNTGYYTAQPYGYTVPQRRGLFGGLFRRRNRVAYPATTLTNPFGSSPAGYSGYYTTTYTTAPGTYYYSTSPY
jgi:hypothetical protein